MGGGALELGPVDRVGTGTGETKSRQLAVGSMTGDRGGGGKRDMEVEGAISDFRTFGLFGLSD